jgi:hypothetical protein
MGINRNVLYTDGAQHGGAAIRPRWRPHWRGFFLAVPENAVVSRSPTPAGRLRQPPHPL